jgi:hypothetical protein
MISITVCLALLCALMLGGLTTASAASAPGTSFIKTYGGSYYDLGVSIRQAKDGSYALIAQTVSKNKDVSGNHGNRDGWVVKLNTNGTIKWKKCIGGYYNEYMTAIQPTKDGGYITAGHTYSTDGNVSGNHGNFDGWVVKFDASGNIKWRKCYGGSDDDFIEWIIQTSDGGYLFAGDTVSTDGDITSQHGGYDGWAVKLDANGKIQWKKELGSAGNELLASVLQTSDGGYLFTGATMDSDFMYKDAWIVKLTAKGDTSWQKNYGGSGVDLLHTVVPAYDGSFVLTGYTESKNGNVSGNHGGMDMWVVKISSSGALKWSKCYGGSGTDFSNFIDRTLDGGFILAGTTASKNGSISGAKGSNDVWLAKLSSTGAIQWKKNYGGKKEDDACSVMQTKDGGYIATGMSYGGDGDFKTNKGNADVFVMKLKCDTLYKKPSLASISAAKFTDAAGSIAKFKATLTTTANASLKLTIYNDKGKIVAILSKSTQFSGSKEFTWNGKATAGNTAGLKTGAKVPIAKTGSSFKYKLTAANAVGSTDSKSFTVKLYS